ncbi:MAG TPA: hypothetical protein VLQ91_22950 [Draconibacterium sp.]|jgi:hypothetical protein|nr:hypothetical protein [Draconibacterium sp.]
METTEDFFNIQEQQLRDNNNLFKDNRLSPYLNATTINLLENFEKFQKELKFTYIVDWQLTENL